MDHLRDVARHLRPGHHAVYPLEGETALVVHHSIVMLGRGSDVARLARSLLELYDVPLGRQLEVDLTWDRDT